MKSVSKHELVKLISICGQVAEHKADTDSQLKTLIRRIEVFDMRII